MSKSLAIVVLSLLLVLLIVFQYLAYFNRKSEENSLRTDTVTITKIDTVTITKPIVKYRYITEVVTDTLYNTDSVLVPVQIPITANVYQDSTYRVVISGYSVSLDTVQVYPIHITTTITNTVTKQKRFNIGIQAGVGYGCFNKKPDVYIGVGVLYRLF